MEFCVCDVCVILHAISHAHIWSHPHDFFTHALACRMIFIFESFKSIGISRLPDHG